MDSIDWYEGRLPFFQHSFAVGADKNDLSFEDYDKLLATFGGVLPNFGAMLEHNDPGAHPFGILGSDQAGNIEVGCVKPRTFLGMHHSNTSPWNGRGWFKAYRFIH